MAMRGDWAEIFKALGNKKRLKIVTILSCGTARNVTQLSQDLKISVKCTSKHLILLRSVGILDHVSRHGYVLYSLSAHLPTDLHTIVRMFVK